jgi:MoaA/NifB/PqqE/SkfB family radical SAM enzyme
VNPKALLGLLDKPGIDALHLKAGVSPIVSKDGRLGLMAGVRPLSASGVAQLASEIMDEDQRRAFAGLRDVDFMISRGDAPKLKARLFSQGGVPALTIKNLRDLPRHPSLDKTPQKRHWVRLTRVCNDHCSFCLDAPAQNGTVLPKAAIWADFEKGRKMGLTRIVLSGGEPTVHPDFIEIVAKAREMGYSHIQTVTNGRRMCYADFLKGAVDAGLSEVTFSLHGHTPEVHDRLTGSPGSFLQGLVALRHALKIPGLIVSHDVVINRQNVRHLRDILDFFIREGVREFDLLQVIPFGDAWEHQEELFYDVEKELPHLQRALDLSKRGDVVLWTNRLPTQYLEGYEDLIQPPTKLLDEAAGRGLMFENFVQYGIKPNCWGRCEHCFLKPMCADIADFHKNKASPAHPVPECLKDDPEALVAYEENGSVRIEHGAEVRAKDFVDFYIRRRYFVKGRACKTCRFDSSCAGAPIDHVRRRGFPRPKPGMLAGKPAS